MKNFFQNFPPALRLGARAKISSPGMTPAGTGRGAAAGEAAFCCAEGTPRSKKLSLADEASGIASLQRLSRRRLDSTVAFSLGIICGALLAAGVFLLTLLAGQGF